MLTTFDNFLNENNMENNVPRLRELKVSVDNFMKKYANDNQLHFIDKPKWSNEMKSEFIESLFLNIPISGIYASEHDNFEWTIIDGAQRLFSLIDFMNGVYKLEGLTQLTNLEGLLFNELRFQDKYRLNSAMMTITLIERTTSENTRKDIIKRLRRKHE
jgi:hypothetical protein